MHILYTTGTQCCSTPGRLLQQPCIASIGVTSLGERAERMSYHIHWMHMSYQIHTDTANLFRMKKSIALFAKLQNSK